MSSTRSWRKTGWSSPNTRLATSMVMKPYSESNWYSPRLKTPTTSNGRGRANMPSGVRVPCGLISCTRSPTFTSSTSARSVPIRIPGTSSGPRVERVGGALANRGLQLRDGHLARRVDALDVDEPQALLAGDHRLAEQRRRRALHARQLQHLLDLGVDVLDAADLEDVDVRGRADDAIAQLALQAGHQRERDEQRHHADGHAEHRDQRDQRDERLLAPRQQIAQGDEELERHCSSLVGVDTGGLEARSDHAEREEFQASRWEGGARHSLRGRISGNRMTSRMEGLLVSSITSRSMPTPSPAVGGRPYSRARM